MHRLFIRLAVIVVLGTSAGALLAAEGAPGESRAERRARLEQWCKDNPEKCREAKAKLEQWREQCKADPEKCRAEMQAGAQQWCKENPEKCRELKAKAERRREECRADPEKCRAEREALRERPRK
jgi:hypothetical protein